MIKAQIKLYPIVYNKQYMHYQILSEHPDKYEECYANLNKELSIDNQIYKLFTEYFDLDAAYIKFMHLSPEIIDEKLILPVYCLVPYLVKLHKGYLIPVQPHAIHISHVRKALNVV